MKYNFKPALLAKPIHKWMVIVICILLISCQNTENVDTKMHDMDKKYLSESELFALNQAIEDDPEEPNYYYKRARIYLERKENQKALKDIQEAIKLKNNDGKLFYLKAQIFYKEQQLDSALKAAKIAESLNVNTSEVKLFLARVNLEIGNKDLAQKYLSEAESLTPYHPEIFYIKGKIKAIEGDTTGALINYFAVLSKDTMDTYAYKELAAIYINKHKYDSALVFIATGKSIDPDEPLFALEEGKIMEKLNLKAASKAFYLNSLQLDSNFEDAFIALGALSINQGNEKDAQLYFEKALKFNPKDTYSNIQLSKIYEKQNRGDLAIPLLERVLMVDSSNKNIKKDLEKLYLAFPESKHKVANDTIKKGENENIGTSKQTPIIENKPKVDSATKVSASPVIRKDTIKKNIQQLPKPENKQPNLQKKDNNKENKIAVPKIKNPDSLKIEKRSDSLSR